ncbi:hypothetical protein, partial [Azohydromonas aeria]|uniref:hypothetical protein n=1 Tax=Azohydromonas aeria TaxID=2590212 RepID=UPI0012F93D8A
MAAQDQDKTRIDADGLHYRAKAAGSVFNKPGQASFSNKTMSCFRCGAHKLLADLATKKILG